MTMSWLELPCEIWTHVFILVESAKDLAQCRLVCSQWNPLAENAMFSKRLTIVDDEDFVNKLYYHISRKPSLAQLIKIVKLVRSSKFDGIPLRRRKFLERSSQFIDLPLYDALLKLVITPDIEILEADNFRLNVQKLVLGIVQSSNRPFDKIKEIPAFVSDNDDDGTHKKLLYTFRGSLQNMFINLTSKSVVQDEMKILLASLHEFKKLRKFGFSTGWGEIVGLLKLEDTLNKLQCAENLAFFAKIDTTQCTYNSNFELYDWFNQHVKKDHCRVKAVTLSSDSIQSDTFVKYVIYKYPKLATLRISDIFHIRADLTKVLEEIRHVETVELSGASREDGRELLKAKTVDMLKSRTNCINISYDNSLGRFARIRKSQITDHSDFIVCFSLCLQSTIVTQFPFATQFLSMFVPGISNITNLEITFLKCTQRDADYNGLFYRILEYVPHVQHLRFGDVNIKYQDTKVVLKKCESLHLVGVNIDDGFITQMSSLAPNLENFSVFGGLFLDKTQCNIILPHISLTNLVLKWSHCDWCTYKKDDSEANQKKPFEYNPEREHFPAADEFKLHGNAYLCVKTKPASEQYFLLTQGTKTSINPISKEHFTLHSQGFAVFNVECASLSSMFLDFGSICTRINVTSN